MGPATQEGAAAGDSPCYKGRMQRYEDALRDKRIDMRQLRRLSFHGIPDRDGLRSTVWKAHEALASFCMHRCIRSSTKHACP